MLGLKVCGAIAAICARLVLEVCGPLIVVGPMSDRRCRFRLLVFGQAFRIEPNATHDATFGISLYAIGACD